jgi:hypothetical protein
VNCAVEVRNTKKCEPSLQLDKIAKEADEELVNIGEWRAFGEANAQFSIETDLGRIHVQITKHALSIIRAIRSGVPIEELAAIIKKRALNWRAGILK